MHDVLAIYFVCKLFKCHAKKVLKTRVGFSSTAPLGRIWKSYCWKKKTFPTFDLWSWFIMMRKFHRHLSFSKLIKSLNLLILSNAFVSHNKKKKMNCTNVLFIPDLC